MAENPADQRNWLERLSDHVPGYNGYVSRERRRDLDKSLREHTADGLRDIKAPLNDVIRELSSGKRLFEIKSLDRLLKKLDRIENQIRFADYGYSGFFDVVKIAEPQLDAIYRFDLRLTTHVQKLAEQAHQLKLMMAKPEQLKASSAALEQSLDDFDQSFNERQQTIEKW